MTAAEPPTRSAPPPPQRLPGDRPGAFPTPEEPANGRTDPGSTAGALGFDLLAEVARPEADPCDLACAAAPGYAVGDLSAPEAVWLLGHTATCGYCAGEVGGYRRVATALDRLADVLVTKPAPRFRCETCRAGFGRVASPLGELFVAATEAGVCEVGFAVYESEDAFRARLEARGLTPERDQAAIGAVAGELGEYFAGHRDRFETPLDFSGVTPFTRSVLNATAEVPFGQLRTYRDIATQLGNPGATRAVGNALGRNPIPVIVPCHRIVRSDHSLGGYTGGVGIKERLLSLEGAYLGSA